ncbi:hypothetical protein QBC35DRAFT_503960 [Podospora australis]|uniref:Uncharacterized protein n=1 Tax=Podospora australis TaxID=1536484 RepID=A0AAN7AG21_9PEZI|nr:hypothetical protein QBC35DRAFT_503960 [Podospora australis]
MRSQTLVSLLGFTTLVASQQQVVPTQWQAPTFDLFVVGNRPNQTVAASVVAEESPGGKTTYALECLGKQPDMRYPETARNNPCWTLHNATVTVGPSPTAMELHVTASFKLYPETTRRILSSLASLTRSAAGVLTASGSESGSVARSVTSNTAIKSTRTISVFSASITATISNSTMASWSGLVTSTATYQFLDDTQSKIISESESSGQSTITGSEAINSTQIMGAHIIPVTITAGAEKFSTSEKGTPSTTWTGIATSSSTAGAAGGIPVVTGQAVMYAAGAMAVAAGAIAGY